MEVLRFGTLYLPARETRRTCVLIADGRIRELLTPAQAAALHGVHTVDLGAYSGGPGLIDLHCHGAAGSDFADGSAEDIARAARYHLRSGTTSLMATVASCTRREMVTACRSVRDLRDEIPNLRGVHLEGPYFHPEWHGCHLAAMIRHPDPVEIAALAPYRDTIGLCTLAPELPGALDFIRDFSASGTVFSIGHSAASLSEIERALEAGLTHSTHLFNAMPKARRGADMILHPGVLESVLLLDGLTTEIIGDGIHVGARLVEWVHRVKGVGSTALVSDALRGVGAGPGEYAFGPRNGQMCRILRTPQVGVVPGADPVRLASSAITLADSLRILADQTCIPLAELWEMASLTPARILGFQDRKGKLAAGHDADIVAVDADLTVGAVFVGGVRVDAPALRGEAESMR